MSNKPDKSLSQYIYGIHSSIALLRSNSESIKKILIKRESKNKQLINIYNSAKEKNINVVESNKDSLTSICLSSKHQGVVCEINPKSHIQFSLDAYLQNSKKPFIIIFDSIQDPRNLGSCIRTANAFGISLIIKRKSQSCGITPLVHKASSGGLQGLSLFESNNLAGIIKKLKKYNIFIIGANHNATESLFALKENNFSSGAAIIIGSEGTGISKSLLKICDGIYKIPTRGSVECLNVSVATGIILYETAKFFKKSK